MSITLALSWGFYALCKKTLPVGPAQGFFLEVLILGVPALGYIGWLQYSGVGHFGSTGAVDVCVNVVADDQPAAPSYSDCRRSALCSISRRR